MQAAQIEGRAANVQHVVALGDQILKLELERESYRELLRRISQSRSMRMAIWLARLARPRRGQALAGLQFESDRDLYIRRRVERQFHRTRKDTVRALDSVPSGSFDTVRVGLCSVPSRVAGLLRVVDRLYDQADEIFVYLNNYPEPPKQLIGDARIKILTGPDMGDRGKFRSVEGFRGYFISVDDDIVYPSSYVDYLIDGIERYKRKAIVGLHGSFISDDFVDYYNSDDRRLLKFQKEVAHDEFVHILGTGCSAFHSDTINVRLEDFSLPNMADIFLASLAQQQQVPCIVLAHPRRWLVGIKSGERTSISFESKTKTGTHRDVALEVNRRVVAQAPWRLNRVEPDFRRPPMRVAVLETPGAAIRKNLISFRLLRDMLAPYGAIVRRIAGGEDVSQQLRQLDAHVVIVQVLAEQAAGHIEWLMNECGDTSVLIDVATRNTQALETVAASIQQQRARGRNVHLIVDQIAAPQLGASEATLRLPRTFQFHTRSRAQFAATEGIAIGDISRLFGAQDLRFPVSQWLKVLSNAMPNVPLYATRDSDVSIDDDLGLDIIDVRGRRGLARLSKIRLVATPLGFDPADSLPINAIGAGVPVIYDGADQALGTYVGAAGVGLSSLEDLDALASLYRDSLSWRRHSRAAEGQVATLSHRALAPVYYRALVGLTRRSAIT